MSGLLQDRIASYLVDHPDRTVREIAGDLRARESNVRRILGSSGLFSQHDGPGRAVTYRLGIAPAGQRPSRPVASQGGETDKDFLHRILSDGQGHSLNEILRRSFAERGCGLTVHSRAAQLRADGLNVVNWKDGQRGDGSWYRLVALDAAAGSPGARRVESAAASSEETLGEGKDEFGTLSESGPVGNAGPPSFPSPSGPSARPGPTSEVGSPAGGPVPLSPRDSRAARPTDLGADRVGVGAAVRGDGQLAFVGPEFRRSAAA